MSYSRFMYYSMPMHSNYKAIQYEPNNRKEIYLLRASVTFYLNIVPFTFVCFKLQLFYNWSLNYVNRNWTRAITQRRTNNNQPIGLDIRLNWLTECKTQKWSQKIKITKSALWCAALCSCAIRRKSHVMHSRWWFLLDKRTKMKINRSERCKPNGCNLIATSLISCDARAWVLASSFVCLVFIFFSWFAIKSNLLFLLLKLMNDLQLIKCDTLAARN